MSKRYGMQSKMNAATGQVLILAYGTGAPLININLNPDKDFIRIAHEIEKAIRKAEKEAFKHAGERAKELISNIEFEF